MSLADDKKLDSYRFCELPAGMFVYTGPARDKVVFCCKQRGVTIELTPVEALIVAARLAFEGRPRQVGLRGPARQAGGKQPVDCKISTNSGQVQQIRSIRRAGVRSGRGCLGTRGSEQCQQHC